MKLGWSFLKWKNINTVYTTEHAHPPPVHIGRMPAEATFETIKIELMNEHQQIGLNALEKRLEAEQYYLDDVQATLKDWHQATQTLSASAVQRVCDGYDIKGLFWSMSQKKVQQIASFEEYALLNEQLDWIRARERIFKELKPLFEHTDDENSYIYRGM